VTKEMVAVRSDGHLTVRMIGSDLHLNQEDVDDILTDELGIWTLGCGVTTTFTVRMSSSRKEF
jgi:hypothetical protein